jgi:hypothetical protein
MMEFVSWDDDIPIWKNNIHVPNHQPDLKLPSQNINIHELFEALHLQYTSGG